MAEKIVLVTGCSKLEGIGYNLTTELLACGHKVIATVRNIKQSAISASEIADHQNLDLRELDLTVDSSIQKLTSQVLEKYGYIDVLVNNAANVMVGPVESATKEDLQTTFQTKVFGPLQLIKSFIPSMRKNGSGLITAPGSIFSSMPVSALGLGVYLSALIAFERIQDALAIELNPWNIKVVNFHPGPVKTKLSLFEGSRKEILEKYYKNYTMHAYKWFDKNTKWQDAKEVAVEFAKMINQDNPDYFTYSSNFAREFAGKYLDDVTGNSYIESLLDHFKSLDDYADDDWSIK